MAPELVSTSNAEEIVQTCQALVGDRLRSITYFTKDDFDQLYLRDDLERDADLTSFIGVEWRESGITHDAYRNSELGEYRYTLRVFDNGYLLRVSTEGDGVFITTDGLTVGGFNEVADALIELLEELPGNR